MGSLGSDDLGDRLPRENLGELSSATTAALAALVDRDAVRRLWERDHTLWQQDPTEVADRLGWLDGPTVFAARLDELGEFPREVARSGLTHAVVVGMGGSSLFPEVLAHTFATTDQYLELLVLDSTDPGAVRRIEREVPLDQALFAIASKSGTTIETRTHLDYFWHLMETLEDGRPGRHFCAITDPGSELAALAAERDFCALFENPPDMGGRFSALSYFGLVPAALMGVDVAGLLGQAGEMAAATREPPAVNPAARLAAVLLAGVEAGRDKLTLVLPDEVASFGDWVEQLVAESTGKAGTGILPVVHEPLGSADVYGDDRLFVALGEHPGLEPLAAAGHPVVSLPYGDALDLGAEVFRWEVATALVGAGLGVNPFDQPDVQAAKDATARVLRDGTSEVEVEPVASLLEQIGPGDYLAIQAFVDPDSAVVERIEEVRVALRERTGAAVTVGIGPRYLHSTGQLHKGGPPTGVFLQVVSEDGADVEVPGRPYGFAALKRAQADGDLVALRERGRRAARVDLDDLLALAPVV